MLIPFSKRVSAYVLCITAAVVTIYAQEEDTIIVMPDAGRRMRLGEFYDARIDTVIPGRLWNMTGDFFDTYKYETPASHTSINFVADENFSSRLSLLDIDIEAAFRLVKGTITIDIEGSFKYVTDDRSSNKSIKYAVAYRTRTKRETLDVFNGKMLAAANQRIFSGTDDCNDCKLATHFVSSITWGADVVASFESFYKDASEKSNMEIWLKGALELAGPTKINAEIEGRLNITDMEKEFTRKTNVKIVGDLRMDKEIPTTPIEAMKFFKSLPNVTNTLNPKTLLDNDGNGVPMSITLTPLSWIDSEAARLARRIKNDILVKLIKIYDSLEESAAYIRDIVSLEFGGFTSWKRSVDAYYKNFEVYRAHLVLEIFAATNAYIIGESGVNAITKIEVNYWKPTNKYNRYTIITECQERQNTIINLMALVSQFEASAITFAEDLSDFYAPTFDSRYDRVYALIVVGMNPTYTREGITKIREFVDLANSRLMKTKDDDSDEEYDGIHTHCVKKQVGGTTICTEYEKFVVIHFDSYCSDLCDSRFCPATNEKDMCPITAKSSSIKDGSCYYDTTEEEKFGCVANRHSGMCWIDKDKNPVNYDTPSAKMNPDHDITVMEKPLSDCWCSCPQTQIMQFVQSRDPERLEENMPRVPERPEIGAVTGHSTEDMEDIGKNQVIQLDMTPDVKSTVRSWKLFVAHEVPQVMDNGEVQFKTKEKVIYTKTNSHRITLKGLSAGQTYKISVTGMNQVGEGRPSKKKEVTIQHRLVDLHVSKDDPGKPAERFNSLKIKSWLDMFLQMRLSSKIFGEISRVTFHYMKNSEPTVIDGTEFDEVGAPLTICNPKNNETNVKESVASCSLKPLYLDEDTDLEIRIWDDTDLLVAKNYISFKAPTDVDCAGSDACHNDYTIIPSRFKLASCPSFMEIETQTKCLEAGGKDPADDINIVDDGDIPKGCSIEIGNTGARTFYFNKHASGKSKGDYDNACMRSSIKLDPNDPKKKNCHSNNMVTEKDCVGASVPLGGQLRGNSKITRHVDYAPPGCSILGGWYIHWNSNPRGKNDGGYEPVCKAN